MKTSIAITLIIIATIFSFVSGYSIGSHSDQAGGYNFARQPGGSIATARAAEKVPEPSAPAGGYGASGSENAGGNTAPSAGYGAPSPGYGQ